MASEILPVPGVRQEKEWWYDRYFGTADALIRAGIVEERMLPGQPDRNKVCVTLNGKRGQQAGGPGYIQIRRTGKNRFVVTKGLDQAERERRKAEQEAKEEAGRAAQDEKARRDALPLYDAPQEAAQSWARFFWSLFGWVQFTEQTRDGKQLGFSDKTLKQITAAARDLYWLIHNAPVIDFNVTESEGVPVGKGWRLLDGGRTPNPPDPKELR